LFIALYLAIPADVKRFKEIKYGRRLKGPVMLTPKQFNKVLATDGLAIRTDDKGLLIRIPRRSEPAHMQIMGDTGVGKTTLLMQMLQQIEDRGDLAIIYDPAGEFTQRFHRHERKDWILNPFDARCSHWSPSSELRSPSEARTIAASLYQPTKDKKGEFFTETPQKVFAHLLKYRPSAQDLVAWLSDENEIDKRVAGTEMAYMIAKGAQQQRSGVLASMGLIADSLRLLPTKEQSDGREWSAADWADNRKGWIFLTSSETEQEALRPLHSLWIDLLILRLLTIPKPGQKRVWFVIDELATLQFLPQFHTALTKSRKSNNPIIFGYQGKAQLEVSYGHLAEVMLSQPAIKLIAKTAEPKAAKWASELLGNVEIERVRESIAHGKRAGSSFTMDRQIEPLVMDSEIQGLADLHAFMKVGNYVSRFAFPHMNAPIIAKAFIPRDADKDAFWLTLPGETTPPPPASPPKGSEGQVGLHLTQKTNSAPKQADSAQPDEPETALSPAFRSSGPRDL
jgi:type IV secretory pathway TraG/TraD family ATPase VirD4